MSNSNSKQRKKRYPFIVAKQGGEYCIMCCRTIKQLIENGESGMLCIDHKDNNNSNNSLKNLQLLCKSCNTKKNHPSLDLPFERTATPELSLGRKFEKDFRRWVQGQFLVNANIGLEYEHLVNSGAERIGCSTETIKRYLRKMTSSEGMYEWNERTGSVLLVLKDKYK